VRVFSLALVYVLISADVEWSGLFQDTNTSDPVPLANGTYPNIFWPLDIYRDVSTFIYDTTLPRDNSTNTTSTTNTTTSDIDLSNYWFRVDNGSTPHIGSIGLHPWDSFETDISFGQSSDVPNILTQPLMAYPFDLWTGDIVFVANFHDPGQPDNQTTSSGTYSGANVMSLASARLQDNSRK